MTNAREPNEFCFYCNCLLEPMNDYSCISCGRLTCDNDCEICDDRDCGLITCVRCFEPHMQTEHPGMFICLSMDFPTCG